MTEILPLRHLDGPCPPVAFFWLLLNAHVFRLHIVSGLQDVPRPSAADHRRISSGYQQYHGRKVQPGIYLLPKMQKS